MRPAHRHAYTSTHTGGDAITERDSAGEPDSYAIIFYPGGTHTVKHRHADRSEHPAEPVYRDILGSYQCLDCGAAFNILGARRPAKRDG